MSGLFCLIFLFGITGLATGSFVYCVSLRYINGQPLTFARSSCEACSHQLHTGDLIPLVSYCMLKGRCRYCRQRLSLAYPLLELTMGLFFVSILCLHLPTLQTFLLLFIVSILMILSMIDLAIRIVPHRFLLVLLILWIVIAVTVPGELSPLFLIHAPSITIILTFFSLVTRGSIGGGDIKLLAVLSLFLPVSSFLLLLLIATGSALLAACLLYLFKKKLLKTVPFVPFITAGFIVAYTLTPTLLNVYNQFLSLI